MYKVLGIVALVVVIVAGFIISGYNKAIRLDETVSEQWAQIETQLKRRYDLIPNLVSTVKGYAKHEKELFTHIADARKAYFQAQTPAEKMRAATRMEGFLSRLLMLQEKYPELKANESFLKLQDSLEGTENRIAVARKRYNEAVKELNYYARSFWGRFMCSLAGVEKREYFRIEKEEEKEPVKVEF